MKKIICVLMCVSLLFLISCSSEDIQLKDIKNRGVLRVGIKTDVPFFGYLNTETNEITGMEIDLAKALAKSILGDEDALELVAVTAKTRGPFLENGGVDVVIATFTITDERKEIYNFSDSYYTEEIGFLVKLNSPAAKISDLDGMTIGHAQASTAIGILEKMGEDSGMPYIQKEYASYPEIHAVLLNGGIDAFCADKSILRGYIDGQTKLLAEGFNPQDYGIATKLENKQLARYVDDFIRNQKKSGELYKTIADWGL